MTFNLLLIQTSTVSKNNISTLLPEVDNIIHKIIMMLTDLSSSLAGQPLLTCEKLACETTSIFLMSDFINF